MISNNNKRRTLHRLAVTRAWFDLVQDSNPLRYTFHMDVSFQNERLGGGEDDPVRFRIGLKKCELVVVLPRDKDALKIDPRTIASDQSPAYVTIDRKTLASAEMSGSGALDVGPAGMTGSANLAASATRARSVEATTNEVMPVLLGMRSESTDGNLSWSIERTNGPEILKGQFWDAKKDEPRFVVVDQRPIEVREQEARTGLHATVTVEVRCKREDLDITHIELTKPSDIKLMGLLPNRKKSMKAAEAFIKHQLQKEGLSVGDIHEPFSDLVVGDLLVSLVENADS